jgi:hypothetical protein
MIAGCHIHHEDLPYAPRNLNAIAATSSGHVLIAQYKPPTIHIHDEGGRKVGEFTRQQMRLAEEDRIHGISYSREDGVLHVLAGRAWDTIRSVQAFRVSHQPPEKILPMVKYVLQ